MFYEYVGTGVEVRGPEPPPMWLVFGTCINCSRPPLDARRGTVELRRFLLMSHGSTVAHAGSGCDSKPNARRDGGSRARAAASVERIVGFERCVLWL